MARNPEPLVGETSQLQQGSGGHRIARGCGSGSELDQTLDLGQNLIQIGAGFRVTGLTFRVTGVTIPDEATVG